MSDRLFGIEEVPEVPLLREPRRRGAAVGSSLDARFKNDYPPEWDKCVTCGGYGRVWGELHTEPETVDVGEEVQVGWTIGADIEHEDGMYLTTMAVGRGGVEAVRDHKPDSYIGGYSGFRKRDAVCPDCLGMGSVKARVRYEAGFRCERCKHPYIPFGDDEMLREKHRLERGWISTAEPSWREGGWSRCDQACAHPMKGTRFRPRHSGGEWNYGSTLSDEQMLTTVGPWTRDAEVEAGWRILTVHHLDGDKANLRWWNLAALCQACHLHIQNKVVMERVYPFEHSEWFKPHVAGYYAFVYLCAGCGELRENRESHHTIEGRPGSPVSDDGYYPHPFEPGLELTREQAMERMDELLGLELAV